MRVRVLKSLGTANLIFTRGDVNAIKRNLLVHPALLANYPQLRSLYLHHQERYRVTLISVVIKSNFFFDVHRGVNEEKKFFLTDVDDIEEKINFLTKVVS